MLESLCHEDNTFVTLTYDNDHLPKGGSLDPNDTKKFLYRIRKNIQPRRIRYYLVGEYGSRTWRPHAHIALFGYPNCERGCTPMSSRSRNKRCCNNCETIKRAWGKGGICLGTLTLESAQYVGGYVTKKLTSKKSDYQKKMLGGLYPEYARMSLRPGVGALAVPQIINVYKKALENDWISSKEDVPNELQYGKKKWPLGRYLRQKLREAMGRPRETPTHALQKIGWEMRFLLEKIIQRDGWNERKIGQIFVDAYSTKMLSLEKRNKIYEQEKTI